MRYVLAILTFLFNFFKKGKASMTPAELTAIQQAQAMQLGAMSGQIAQAPKVPTPLEGAQRELEAALEELSFAVDRLDEHLQPVLRKGIPLNGIPTPGAEKQLAANLSPLVESLRNIRGIVEREIAHIKDLSNRLDV